MLFSLLLGVRRTLHEMNSVHEAPEVRSGPVFEGYRSQWVNQNSNSSCCALLLIWLIIGIPSTKKLSFGNLGRAGGLIEKSF